MFLKHHEPAGSAGIFSMDDIFQIPLTNGGIAIVDAEDRGLVEPHSWFLYKGKTGSNVRTTVLEEDDSRKVLSLHRVVTKAAPKQRIDHRDHDVLNNRKKNLRRCNAVQNAANALLSKRNKTGFKGVSFIKRNHFVAKPWRAHIGINGKLVHLGYFATAEEAAAAYDAAAILYFGEFAYTNAQMITERLAA